LPGGTEPVYSQRSVLARLEFFAMVHIARAAPPPVDARGDRFLIVEGRFYEALNDQLIAGAKTVIEAAGGEVVVVTMRGALEIPAAILTACKKAASAGRPFSGAVALGVVIRGDTSHYDIVANESSHGIMELTIRLGLPIANGILTVENMAQAEERADVARMNKGGDAAEAMLQLYALEKQDTL
jgi:6,7-dimethyl-8-ribityllumazine synthase